MNDALFQRLWSKAVGHPDYDKEEWKKLEKQFFTSAPIKSFHLQEYVMYCGNCGKKIIDDSFLYCPHCGRLQYKEVKGE